MHAPAGADRLRPCVRPLARAAPLRGLARDQRIWSPGASTQKARQPGSGRAQFRAPEFLVRQGTGALPYEAGSPSIATTNQLHTSHVPPIRSALGWFRCRARRAPIRPPRMEGGGRITTGYAASARLQEPARTAVLLLLTLTLPHARLRTAAMNDYTSAHDMNGHRDKRRRLRSTRWSTTHEHEHDKTTTEEHQGRDIDSQSTGKKYTLYLRRLQHLQDIHYQLQRC